MLTWACRTVTSIENIPVPQALHLAIGDIVVIEEVVILLGG